MANLKGTRLSSMMAPSMSNISSSDSLVESPLVLPFSATLRVNVSIAWEIRDFSRAANMVLASTPLPTPPWSPLLDPLSVEVSSVSFKSVLPPAMLPVLAMSVSIKNNNRKIKKIHYRLIMALPVKKFTNWLHIGSEQGVIYALGQNAFLKSHLNVFYPNECHITRFLFSSLCEKFNKDLRIVK